MACPPNLLISPGWRAATASSASRMWKPGIERADPRSASLPGSAGAKAITGTDPMAAAERPAIDPADAFVMEAPALADWLIVMPLVIGFIFAALCLMTRKDTRRQPAIAITGLVLILLCVVGLFVHVLVNGTVVKSGEVFSLEKVLGEVAAAHALGLAALVADLNPPWDSPAVGDRVRAAIRPERMRVAAAGGESAFGPVAGYVAARSATGTNLIGFLASHRPAGAGTEYGSGHAQATGGALRPADWNDFAARIGFPEETLPHE